MLIAARRPAIVGDYRHPRWMTILGVLVAVAMAGLGLRALTTDIPALFR
jgi:Mn2+/Fe2+ NRAMP family transporter